MDELDSGGEAVVRRKRGEAVFGVAAVESRPRSLLLLSGTSSDNIEVSSGAGPSLDGDDLRLSSVGYGLPGWYLLRPLTNSPYQTTRKCSDHRIHSRFELWSDFMTRVDSSEHAHSSLMDQLLSNSAPDEYLSRYKWTPGTYADSPTQKADNQNETALVPSSRSRSELLL